MNDTKFCECVDKHSERRREQLKQKRTERERDYGDIGGVFGEDEEEGSAGDEAPEAEREAGLDGMNRDTK